MATQMSKAYKEAIRSGQRGNWDARLYIEGVEYPKENIKSMKIYELEFSDEKVGIGNVIINRVEMQLRNIHVPLSNKKVTFKIGLEINGAYEYVQFGDYWITEVSGTEEQEVRDVTAYDSIKKTSGTYSTSLSYPASIEAVTMEILNRCGLTLVPTAFRNFTFNTAITADTDRDALGIIAQLMGANVLANRQSQVEFRMFKKAMDIVILPNQYYDWTKADRYNYIRSVQCNTGSEILIGYNGAGAPDAEADGVDINISNKYATKALIDAIALDLTYYYRSGQASFIGDPSIEVGDQITMQDKQGGWHCYLVMENIIEYDGGIKNTIDSYGESEEGQELSATQKSTDEKIENAMNNTLPDKVDDYFNSDLGSNTIGGAVDDYIDSGGIDDTIGNKTDDYLNSDSGKQQIEQIVGDAAGANGLQLNGLELSLTKDGTVLDTVTLPESSGGTGIRKVTLSTTAKHLDNDFKKVSVTTTAKRLDSDFRKVTFEEVEIDVAET